MMLGIEKQCLGLYSNVLAASQNVREGGTPLGRRGG